MYRYSILVSQDAIDANGHANNVEYLHWMQDAAVSHADAAGGTDATRNAGASWVVRSHHVEYLQPTFAGDRLVVLTWVSNFRKVRSLRKYLLLRETDRAVIARREPDWVFVEPIRTANCITGLPFLDGRQTRTSGWNALGRS